MAWLMSAGFGERVRVDQHAGRSPRRSHRTQTQLAQRRRRHPAVASRRILLQAGTHAAP